MVLDNMTVLTFLFLVLYKIACKVISMSGGVMKSRYQNLLLVARFSTINLLNFSLCSSLESGAVYRHNTMSASRSGCVKTLTKN